MQRVDAALCYAVVCLMGTKWVNQFRCHFRREPCGPKECCIIWGSIFFTGRGTFEGDMFWPIVTYLWMGALYIVCLLSRWVHLLLQWVLWHFWLGSRKGIRPVKKLSGRILVWLSVWGNVQICVWPSWCYCHSLFLASVNPDWFHLSDTGSPG